MPCRNAARALEQRAAREGIGRSRGQGSSFHKVCLELLPYLHMVNLCYTPPLELISTYCGELKERARRRNVSGNNMKKWRNR
jgi:hypothetical protein